MAKTKALELKRGYVYEVMLRFETNPRVQVKKMAVCLQGDDLCELWTHANFARTHSFKDNKTPLILPWDVFVLPAESQSEFGIKIICNEVWPVEKDNIVRDVYKLPDNKIEEMDRKLIFAIGQ